MRNSRFHQFHSIHFCEQEIEEEIEELVQTNQSMAPDMEVLEEPEMIIISTAMTEHRVWLQSDVVKQLDNAMIFCHFSNRKSITFLKNAEPSVPPVVDISEEAAADTNNSSASLHTSGAGRPNGGPYDLDLKKGVDLGLKNSVYLDLNSFALSNFDLKPKLCQQCT